MGARPQGSSACFRFGASGSWVFFFFFWFSELSPDRCSLTTFHKRFPRKLLMEAAICALTKEGRKEAVTAEKALFVFVSFLLHQLRCVEAFVTSRLGRWNQRWAIFSRLRPLARFPATLVPSIGRGCSWVVVVVGWGISDVYSSDRRSSSE